MSRTNNVANDETVTENEVVSEKVETVKETVEEVKKTVEPIVAKKPGMGPVAAMSAETQRMNARQFFDTYPHDNNQVVNLIITLYGNQIKTVAQWETFYQQMLKKRVS